MMITRIYNKHPNRRCNAFAMHPHNRPHSSKHPPLSILSNYARYSQSLSMEVSADNDPSAAHGHAHASQHLPDDNSPPADSPAGQYLPDAESLPADSPAGQYLPDAESPPADSPAGQYLPDADPPPADGPAIHPPNSPVLRPPSTPFAPPGIASHRPAPGHSNHPADGGCTCRCGRYDGTPHTVPLRVYKDHNPIWVAMAYQRVLRDEVPQSLEMERALGSRLARMEEVEEGIVFKER